MKRNIYETLFIKPSIPKKVWNEIPIKNESELKGFIWKNMYWFEEIICKIFDFTKIDFLDFEYSPGASKKRFDLAFRHGEDIIIVELKYGYGSESSKAYYQLQEYEDIITKDYVNKVYKVLITTHLTKGIIELFKKEKNKTGIILLSKSDIHNIEHLHCINWNKTRYGFIYE